MNKTPQPTLSGHDTQVLREPLEMPSAPRWAALGAPYVQPVAAWPLPEARLLYWNTGLAAHIGLDQTGGDSPEVLSWSSGNAPWPRQQACASAYAGHQFGNWVSRLGDGRATLRSSVRELLACEALHAPGFGHFGHFEFHAHHGTPQQLQGLADHVITHHFAHLAHQPQRHAAWLGEVIERTAALFAHWQTLGFCHGVLNTDNLSVLELRQTAGRLPEFAGA